MNWNKKLGLELKPRPWYEWLGWVVWLLLEIFLLQNALGSQAELQSTAATIFWVMFIVFLIAGAVVWYVRRPKETAAS